MLFNYFFISSILFFIGLFGIVLNSRAVLIILLCVELLLLSINLNFIFFSFFLDDFFGELFAVYVLAVAASESAVGLAILVSFYRIHGNLSTSSANLLQG